MICIVKNCTNDSDKVRGHSIVARNEDGREVYGFVCNPCWHFMIEGTNHMSTLARNGRKRPTRKEVE